MKKTGRSLWRRATTLGFRSLSRNELFQCLPGDEESRVFKLLTRLPIRSGQLDIDRGRRLVVAKDRVVPSFDVQVRIITHSKQGVDDLTPIGLAKTREPMLGH